VRRFTALYIFFTIFNQAQSQHGWEAKVLPGFLVPHHSDMANQAAHVTGFEFGREWKVDSMGFIAKRQQEPYAGIALSYFNLGNSINGNAFTIQNFYDAGIKLHGNTTLRGRFSVGLGYLTKEYNNVTNPMNRSIGSNFNGFMQILTYVQTPISKRTFLNLGIGMSHYSNGNWSMPNLGINLPSMVLGFKYRENNTKYLHSLRTYTVPNRIQWQFSARMGRRQIGIDNPKNIANYLLEADIIYPHNAFRLWRVGVVSFFDRTYVYEKFQALPNKIRPDQITEIAIQCGHEYRIGRFGFVTDLGFYIYRPDKTKRMYYEGVGLKLYVNENLVLINRLKAHLTSADYFEWGLCYNFTSNHRVRPGFVNGWKWVLSGFKSGLTEGTPSF
jgi:Lipid A 3-O-deacylase (PagL)